MYSFNPQSPSPTDAEQASMLDFELNDALYDVNNEKSKPQVAVGADTITDSFYEEIMNPMYNFESPYMIHEYSSNSVKEQTKVTCDEVKVNNEMPKSNPEIDRFIPIMPYNIREAGQMPNLYCGMYPYNTGFRGYEMQEVTFSPNGLCQYPWTNGEELKPFQRTVSMTPMEYPMNTTHSHETRDDNDSGARTTFTPRSTPSATSNGSPILQSEALYPSTGRSTCFSGNQGESHDEICDVVTPTAIKGGYSVEQHNYNTTRVPNETDVYNQTYTDNSLEGNGKPSQYWYHTWKHGDNQNYANVPTFNGGKEYMVQRHPVVQARPYTISHGPYPGNVIYNVDGGLGKAYMYDNEIMNGYNSVPDETSYYNPGPDYMMGMNGNEFLDDTVHSVNIVRQVSLTTQPPHVAQGFDGSYPQSPHREGFYSPQTLPSSPIPKVQSEEYNEDPLEISVEDKGGGTSKISMETLKNINRNEIDFIRMSDSLWQTLRSTGMFKLGNKGRAILKSKISKQLKMNPKLRMRALCISGVRRATTRQLFQLAQICGIRSHLK